MNKKNLNTKLLGSAFLFQAIASAIGMLLLKDPLIVSGDIIATMTNISNNQVQMGLSNVVIVFTALGVACLGTLMYTILKDQNEIISRIALGFYLIEAAILAVSRIPPQIIVTRTKNNSAFIRFLSINGKYHRVELVYI